MVALSDITTFAKTHKPLVIGTGVGAVGLLVLRGRKAQAGAAQSSGQYLTPDVLASSPAGSVLSITGGGGDGTGGVEPLIGPTGPFGSLPLLTSGGSGTGSNPQSSSGPTPQLLAIPERAPNTPLTTGTTSAGTLVSYPSFFKSADQAQQFQNLENQNALSTPAQQAEVLKEAAANPQLGNYLKAVQAAGY